MTYGVLREPVMVVVEVVKVGSGSGEGYLVCSSSSAKHEALRKGCQCTTNEHHQQHHHPHRLCFSRLPLPSPLSTLSLSLSSFLPFFFRLPR